MKTIITFQTKSIFIIFVFAFFLRLINLGSFPVGFHSDEARVGWNAISIAQTGHDDWGNFLPLYYNTFGDYRPAGIIYATIPSILLFGRTEFAVRFPSALFGALAVFPIATLAAKIATKKNDKMVGVFASILWAVTPWSFSTSRATSEVVISSTLVLFALAIFTTAIQSTRLNRKQLFISFFLFVLSTFFYHTARILVPLYWILFAIYFRREITRHGLSKIVAIGAVALLMLTGIFSLGTASRGRLSQVSILNPPVLSAQTTTPQPKPNIVTTIFNASRVFTIQYATYLSPEFLIGDVGRPLRYTTTQNGLISVAVFVLFLIGISLVIKKKITSLPFVLLLVSPLPAALTIEDVPNLHRAFFMLPFLIILAALGLQSLRNKSVLFIPIIIVAVVSFIGFTISYFGPQSRQLATFRNGNAKEMALYLNEVSVNYDKVYVTNDPDSPYPWYAFFGNKTPFEFNAFAKKRTQGSWEYQNIIFAITRCPSGQALDKNSSKGNILIIDGYKCERAPVENDHPEARVIKEFLYPNGEVVYRVWERR